MWFSIGVKHILGRAMCNNVFFGEKKQWFNERLRT